MTCNIQNITPILFIGIIFCSSNVFGHNTHHGEQWEYDPFHFGINGGEPIGGSPKEACDAYSVERWGGVATKLLFIDGSPSIKCLMHINTNNIGPNVTAACRNGTPIPYEVGFSSPGTSVGGVSCHCPKGSYFDQSYNWCVSKGYEKLICPQPYTFNEDKVLCEAYCVEGDIWNSMSEVCEPPPQEQNCKTQGKSPIDFIEGRKYRYEPVLTSGVRYPFFLTYYFNNQRSQEKSPVGSKVAVVNGDRYLAATKPPMTASEYQALYTNRGVPKGGTVYRESQHYGSVDQYWRHNFDDVLLVRGNQFLYQSAKGEEIVFNGLGSSAAYSSLVLESLASGEEAFSGYKLTNRRSREVRKFDKNGRLIKLERSPHDVLILTYDNQDRLDRITNSEGAYIELAYQDLVTGSVYSISSTVHSYPVSVTNDRGESSQISWGKSYQGKTETFHLITQITEASTGAAQSARTFEYNDTRWPASITDQYVVADIGNSTNKQPALHFEYDDLGRAIFSGLSGRASDTVTYVDANTRVVTNTLGKQATYTFADFEGVKRLQSVTGEPTQNCVSSEVSYEYDANGNLSRKTQNGQMTEYQYDSQNREISRTEAAGTPEARTVTTEYHPTLSLPVRIVEPGRVEVMTYDGSGRLLSKNIQPTTAPSP